MSRHTDAFDKVHPDLVDLLIRLDLLPTKGHNRISEAYLARTIFLALELADPEEQALLVSRIMPEDELAAQRLRSPEVQNTSHRVVLDREERRAAFLPDPSEPEPESIGEECIVCTESAHVRVPCGCNYCLSCYREALRLGLRSQEEFPPKCCQPFDETAVALARSPTLVHIFRQMDEERQIPIPDRVYCHDGNCAAFIPPDRKGRCLICHDKTCLDCGARRHRGQPCTEGDVEEDVWATMDANRTVNCPDCGRMIELSAACNHMKCPCLCEFCYLCGVGWKDCRCTLYGGFETMVPMRDRPGVKPPQFRRRPRTEAPTSQNVGTETLRIPRLRPNSGEEERQCKALASRRVIRPLALPQHEEALREQQLKRERAQIARMVQRPQIAEMQRRLPVQRQLGGMFHGILPDPFPPVVNDRQAVPRLPNAYPIPNPPQHDALGGHGRLGYRDLVGRRMVPGGFEYLAPAMGHRGREEQHQRHEAVGGMLDVDAIGDMWAAQQARRDNVFNEAMYGLAGILAKEPTATAIAIAITITITNIAIIIIAIEKVGYTVAIFSF
ncbi:hypothetical protein FVEN_g1384 [Fusarium venenatum]|nr:hypothetical protein FVEN_g1384 [Fusarium venenatum]